MAGGDRVSRTRDGHPEMWGQAEIAEYANEVADKLGRPRPRRGRTWTWDRLAGFPKPVAELQMGNVYLAGEIRPWVDQWMQRAEVRHSTKALPEATRAAILQDKGTGSIAEVAAKHGVGSSTVHRIWTE